MFNYIPQEDGVTYSLLQKFTSCRVAARFYLEGFRGVRTSEALNFGNACHYILEQIYRSKNVSLKKIDMYAEEWEDYILEKDPGANPDALGDVTDIAKTVLKVYMKVYRSDFKTWKKLSVESTFDVMFHGYRLRGKRDGLFTKTNKKGKENRYLLEHKTAGQINEDLISDSLSFDPQNLFYIIGTELQDDSCVRNTLRNVIRRPQIRFKVSQTWEEYKQEITKDCHTRPDHYFKRFETSYKDKDIEIYRKELFELLKEFDKWNKGESPTYRNTSACAGKGWQCEYLPACSSRKVDMLLANQPLFTELEED